jgi:hypothetical protein
MRILPSPQDLRRILLGGLANQQVHMLRHDHISNKTEGMSVADFIQDFYEMVSRPSRPEQWPPPITTERDEMQIAMSVMPFERVAHREKNKTRTLKPEGCGTPVSPSMKCGSGMLIPCTSTMNKKLSLRHPPALEPAAALEEAGPRRTR